MSHPGGRRRKKEEHANHERWMVSYADFVTLLLALFVVLYAISEVDRTKLKQVSNSVQFAFHFKGSGGTNQPGIFDRSRLSGEAVLADLPAWAQESHETLKFLTRDLPDAYQRFTGGELRLTLEGDTVGVLMAGRVLFGQGQDSVRPEILPFLERVATGSGALDLRILVVLEIPRPRTRDAMELSYLRLASIDHYLSAYYGVPENRLLTQLAKLDPREIGPVGDVLSALDDHTVVKVLLAP